MNMEQVSGNSFAVEQVIVGKEGTLIFGKGGSRDIFYSPKGDDTNFYQLHSQGEASSWGKGEVKREITVATDTRGGSFRLVVEYGKAASLTCGNTVSAYSCLSSEAANSIESKIQSGQAKLFSLPVDRRVEYAVEVPKSFEGKDGYLVVTSPKYNYSYEFDAYLVPQDKTEASIKFDVEGVQRFRDGGTTFMTIGKSHNFHAATPFRGGQISVDGEEARKLSETEVSELISDDRVPSVPKTPAGLITPFTNPLAGGPAA